MHLDGLDVAHPQRFVVGKVLLHYDAAIQRDLIAHDVTDAKADRPFDLGFDDIGVHRHATVDGCGVFLDLNIVIFVDRDFADLRTVGTKGFVHSHTVEMPVRQRLAKPGILGSQFKDVSFAYLIGCVAGQIRKTEADGILTGCGGGHIHHGFHDIGVMAVTDGAPIVNGCCRGRICQADVHSGDRIGIFCRPFHRRNIHTVFDIESVKWPIFCNGLTRHAVIPANNLARIVQTDTHLVRIGRAVPAARQVIFAGPDQFNRAGLVGHRKGQCRFYDIVRTRVEATAKEPACIKGFDLNLVHRDAKDLVHRGVVHGWTLRAVIHDHAAVFGGCDGGRQGLHRCVGQHWQEEFALYDLGGTLQRFRRCIQRRLGCLPLRISVHSCQ